MNIKTKIAIGVFIFAWIATMVFLIWMIPSGMELKRMADIGKICESEHWWIEKWNIEEHKDLLNE